MVTMMLRPWAKASLLALIFVLSYRLWLPVLENVYDLSMLPIRWRDASTDSIISQQHDDFDVTFASYPVNQSISESKLSWPIPPILHHIHLGKGGLRPEWLEARAACMGYHGDWQAYLWDDDNSAQFVGEHFPQLKGMWDSYRYPVQRVDALRYMLLYKLGGVVLDFDLACERSLEPLRKFDFVAPAAHPTGFSIGMLLASPQNSFIGELVHNLPIFNRNWFLLPYATVMFSTGCHYASTIFTLQENRTSLRILAGPDRDPKMHTLNGNVKTPLFRHLGTSSWHNYDALFIKAVGRLDKWSLLLILFSLTATISVVTVFVSRFMHRRCCSQIKAVTLSISDDICKEV